MSKVACDCGNARDGRRGHRAACAIQRAARSVASSCVGETPAPVTPTTNPAFIGVVRGSFSTVRDWPLYYRESPYVWGGAPDNGPPDARLNGAWLDRGSQRWVPPPIKLEPKVELQPEPWMSPCTHTEHRVLAIQDEMDQPPSGKLYIQRHDNRCYWLELD